jgi:hypothetical protein
MTPPIRTTTAAPDLPPLRLMAQDAEDLMAIAVLLQDAVGCVADFAFWPRRRRFAAIFRRFRWEQEAMARAGLGPSFQARRHERVLSALHFDFVRAVRRHNIPQDRPDQPLCLLTLACEAREDGAARIDLLFADDRAIRLEVECIDAWLRDLGPSWPARRRPAHADLG